MKHYKVLSLFTGCGGLDLGFKGNFKFLHKEYSKTKFEIIWANDIDPNACLTYRNNFGHNIVCADIRDLLENKYINLFDEPMPLDTDIVLGGFPCQDFSHAGKRKGFDSKRGTLYQAMSKVIKETKPKLFLAENVKGLLTINNGDAIKQIINDFENLGYNVTYKLLLTANFEVPQKRERVLIVGTEKDILPPFELPDGFLQEDKWLTLNDAICDLENKEEGSVDNHFWSKAKKNKGQGNNVVLKNKPGPTMRAEHHGNIEFHWNGKRRLSAREAARIQSFPDEFIFFPSTSSAYKQIGNAVPPVFAWHIAKSIEKFLIRNMER
ncbi:MAG: DNA (cytosine-5-)-methyltransferase [Candidatus Cloacimonadota bacterium]|nr:MAG: DNA (cytosine-5-)-methyltransferase [Candidatus Cloacimonadota bacterium]